MHRLAGCLCFATDFDKSCVHYTFSEAKKVISSRNEIYNMCSAYILTAYR